ncbi:TetR/AcrR family transcriptional regulator [Sinimarinibacterium sp. CAU 1509]|uniref:TetR/AcrR family transcriptional regulator n=1 Tax=Sinimarinibacterium sp. CAU 1509 TaxID=2562283 RepID=UPI001B7FB9D5|nr:TetR/AcrR family transcriptional regulator [Sinimarinibacterium sp. CAU 1509]
MQSVYKVPVKFHGDICVSRSPASSNRTTARVGRPPRSAQQSAEVRGRVIEVARRLFADEGFEAVSMRRIAAESGCAPMTLYGYFHSKNEILHFIWEVFFEELFVRVAQAAKHRGSAATRLRNACSAYLGYWMEFPDRYRMVYLNQDHTGDGERYYVDESSVIERHAMFRELIEAAQAQADAWPGDVQLMAETLFCGLQGIAHSLVTIPEYPWLPMDQLLEQTLRTILKPKA